MFGTVTILLYVEKIKNWIQSVIFIFFFPFSFFFQVFWPKISHLLEHWIYPKNVNLMFLIFSKFLTTPNRVDTTCIISATIHSLECLLPVQSHARAYKSLNRSFLLISVNHKNRNDNLSTCLVELLLFLHAINSSKESF